MSFHSDQCHPSHFSGSRFCASSSCGKECCDVVLQVFTLRSLRSAASESIDLNQAQSQYQHLFNLSAHEKGDVVRRRLATVVLVNAVFQPLELQT